MVDVPGCIGLEVATAQVDLAVRPTGARWALPNDAGGIVTLVERAQALHPTLLVLAATGGLERAATAALATAGPSSLSPRGRGGMLRVPRASWPRRRREMRACWRLLLT